ncbi:MAG: hypothetical protein QGF09_02180 [Rhodospirillales bacterium]|nr:hypothetical protein [Rhodospirillales bacterium]
MWIADRAKKIEAMNKTVLVFTDSHSLCGIGDHNAALMSALCHAGYRTVCAQRQEDTPLQKHLLEIGVQYHWYEKNPEEDLSAFLNDKTMAMQVYYKVQPDLIYFSNGHPLSSFAAMDIAQILSIPYVIREGQVANRLLPSKKEEIFAMRNHYLNAQNIITASNQNLDILHQIFGLPEGFGTCTPSSTDDEFFSPVDLQRRKQIREKWGIPEDGILCFTTARFAPNKGFDI